MAKRTLHEIRFVVDDDADRNDISYGVDKKTGNMTVSLQGSAALVTLSNLAFAFVESSGHGWADHQLRIVLDQIKEHQGKEIDEYQEKQRAEAKAAKAQAKVAKAQAKAAAKYNE